MSMLRVTMASMILASLAGVSTAQAQTTSTQQATATSASARQQGAVTVKQALVEKLKKSNEAEIELAKLAQQRSDNDEVKQLAKMMVEDHQALNEQLKKFDTLSDSSNSTSTTGAAIESRNSATDRQNQNRGGVVSTAQRDAAEGRSAMVPKELCEISKKACENALAMTKEMLNEYKGQDFNMAYLGQQCVAHTMMLAELKAIQSVGPEEFKPFTQSAISKTESHVEKLKELAKKLEGDSKKQS